jgi:hypothetical protein
MYQRRANQNEGKDCNQCDPGTFTNGDGSAECLACGAGTFGKDGKNQCYDCPIGYARKADDTNLTMCSQCNKGEETLKVGSISCQNCDVGQFGSAPGTCLSCTKGQYQDTKGSAEACLPCLNGKVNDKKSSCIPCAVGKRGGTPGDGFGCLDCEPGKFSGITGAASCTLCNNGRVVGNASCMPCGLGRYAVDPAAGFGCALCDVGRFSNSEGQSECKECAPGKISDEKSGRTACMKPPYKVKEDCAWNTEYLNNTNVNKQNWTCAACPDGAFCPFGPNQVAPAWKEVSTLEHYWRVPWANEVFLMCPFPNDCLGYTLADRMNSSANATVGCVEGTKGPLCSLCIEGYNRDVTACNKCVDGQVPLRASILGGIIVLLVLLVSACRKRIQRQYKKYRTLWRDFFRVVSINITYAQVSSSITSVIEIDWPPAWHQFTRHFEFVNIDVMSLIGASCIGDFNFFLSFLVMLALPTSIILIAVFVYCSSMCKLRHRLAHMTEAESKKQKEDAMHMLFDMADEDHGGTVDPPELKHVLHQVGWKITQTGAKRLAKAEGGKQDKRGVLHLSEAHFLKFLRGGDIEGKIHRAENGDDRHQKDDDDANNRKYKTRRRSSVSGKLKKDLLSDSRHLLKWILKQKVVSSSIATAMQLLLFAHTPVSRKVFQYFHCRDLAGKSLLIADYEVECDSREWQEFLPVVLTVLCMYTILLPAFLILLLVCHRKDLYTTNTYQKIGWLYAPFVRGAEFWMVHDVIFKMILTGLLIYLPTTSRAGYAVLICTLAIINLNYFQPHRNKVLFWLTQLSFVTTGSKYLCALLLAAETTDEDTPFISNLLIGLDLGFLFCSALSVPLIVIMLKSRYDGLNEQHRSLKSVQPCGDNVSESKRRNSTKLANLIGLHEKQFREAVVQDQVVRFEKSHDKAHAASLDLIRKRHEKSRERLLKRRISRGHILQKVKQVTSNEKSVRSWAGTKQEVGRRRNETTTTSTKKK